ncbi:MAG: isoaspartyl peptidase/L-asparaginase [Bacteroidota bacterium]
MTRLSYLLLLPLACVLWACGQTQAPPPSEKPAYVLAIHGGAGTIRKDLMTKEKDAAYRASLRAALAAGEEVLKNGGEAMDAVVAAITLMEDDSLFNSGRGAVLTSEGTAELDASIMDGQSLNAGSVAGVKTIKHPILAARLVMDSSVHVMMAGLGADTYGEMNGLEIVDNNYFITGRRKQQWEKKQEQESAAIKKKYGTVGAVALDQNGNLAAGTSTGGMTNKRFGRVGDAPIIGAGTYADNKSCAVSCTGHGEYFIRNVVAYQSAAQMQFSGKSLEEATNHIIHEVLPPQGGTGGLISVDKDGNVNLPFNTSGMFRGFVKAGDPIKVAIYEEEPK